MKYHQIRKYYALEPAPTERMRDFPLCFASPDVNSCIDTNRTQLFATSLSQSLSLIGS